MTPTQPLDVEIIQTLEEVSQLLWIGTQLSQICGCQTAGKEGLRAMQHCYRKPGAAQKWSFWTELVSSSVKQIDNAFQFFCTCNVRRLCTHCDEFPL